MPEYTLEQIEKAVADPMRQTILFGDTVEHMRDIDPKHIVQTWMPLEDLSDLMKK